LLRVFTKLVQTIVGAVHGDRGVPPDFINFREQSGGRENFPEISQVEGANPLSNTL
jgi:hypothetical protein